MTARKIGMTLIEICIGLAVGIVMMLVMLSIMRGGAAIFGRRERHLEALQTSMMVSEIIREDLRYAVLSGMTMPGTTHPDFRPFLYSDEAVTSQGPDKRLPPVEVPDPVDLTKDPGKTKFSFFRVFPSPGAAGSRPAVEIDGISIGEAFTADVGYKLGMVSYSLRKKVSKKVGLPYYTFIREVRDGEGNQIENIPLKREYRTCRLKHLTFILHMRDSCDIAGHGDPVKIDTGTVSSPLPYTSGQSAPAKPVDYAFYIQFILTGLSSEPRVKDFKDYQTNLLMNVVSFDALSEKLRHENGALYWNSHAAADGYVSTGAFDFHDI